MRRIPAIAGLALALGLGGAGCSTTPDPVVCTADIVSSLVVTVRDAASGQPVCDATVAVLQGTVYLV